MISQEELKMPLLFHYFFLRGGGVRDSEKGQVIFVKFEGGAENGAA
jgi:hypothetical protein